MIDTGGVRMFKARPPDSAEQSRRERSAGDEQPNPCDNEPVMRPSRSVFGGVQALLLHPSWHAGRVAYWLRLDAVLCGWLLATWLKVRSEDRPVFQSLAKCVADVGSPALQSLLYRFSAPRDDGKPASRRRPGRSLAVAAVARRLAIASGYPQPEEAYLSGLLCDFDPDAPALSALGPFAADAVRFCELPPAELRSAHPLVRIVGAACWAVARAEAWPAQEELAGAAALVGLLREAFVAEVLRAQRWVQQVGSRLKASAARVLADQPGMARVGLSWQLQALQESWFLLDSLAELQQSIMQQARVMFDCPAVLLLEPDAEGRCLAVTASVGAHPAAGQLSIDLAVSPGAAASAFRSKGTPVLVTAEAAASQPLIDRQLLGLAGGSAMLCLPLGARDAAPAALAILGQGGDAAQSIDPEAAAALAVVAGTALSACRRRSDRQSRLLDDYREGLQNQARQVGHEIGNALAIVKNYVTILAEQAQAGTKLEGGLKVIGDEVDHVTRMLQALKEPAVPASTAPTDINHLVRGLLTRLGPAYFTGRSIVLQTELDGTMPMVTTDAFALRQGLMNLCRNAVEAMRDGGQLLVWTSARVNWGGRVFVEVGVRDSGPGISKEALPNVFHPVATGKGAEHAGLGLSIVKESVARLGGEVLFRNTRGAGAEFSILIPLQVASASAGENKRG
jgi:signal transduction histidine kinase